MNEEKIIKRLNLRINNLKTDYAITNEDLQAIQGLLDLYNNKSKELEEEKKKNKELFLQYEKRVDELEYQITTMISKDKIKEKIKYLMQLDFGTDLVTQSTANLTTISILQELLKE